MKTNQLFPDVSFDRRPKTKEIKKLNLIELFPNISAERLPKSKVNYNRNLIQLFPDISGEIRSKIASTEKLCKVNKLKTSFFKTSELVDNKDFQWLLVIFTLSGTLLLYFKTFSL
jgi:hypothetical protein